MTDELREEMLKSLAASGRRMRRDKKYRIKVLSKLGILTPKGNLTKRWKEFKKWYLQNTVPIQPDRD